MNSYSKGAPPSGPFFNLLLVFALLFTASTLKAQDYAYTISDGEITITRYTGPGGVVTLPATIGGLPVTRIRGWAFQYSGTIEEVTIPENVSHIGDWAFAGCAKLRKVFIPSTVTNIGDFAFIRCTSLTDIQVDPGNLFYSSLEGVLFDKNQQVLIQCPGGKPGSYTLPNTVTRVGPQAFDNCHGLTSIDLGDSVTNIGTAAFYFCGNLLAVTVPATVANLDSWTFQYCTNLAGVYFSGNAPGAGPYAFYACGPATAYHLSGRSGWGKTFAQLPTSVWSPASLRIFLGPTDAVTAGGRWRVGTGAWQETGATVTNLVPGDYSVCFSDASAWIAPTCQTLTVKADRITIGSGVYVLAASASATATAMVSDGFVIGAGVVKPGDGYTNTPTVYLVGGGGSGAEAVAIVQNRKVVGITVINAGFGYTAPPSVVITKPGLLPLELAVAPTSVLSFSNLEPGTAYQLQALISDQWLDVATPVNVESPTYSHRIDESTDRWSYRLVSLPRPAQAVAEPFITNGFLVRVQLTSGGVGYTSTPAIKVIGGGGKNAQCRAIVQDGIVTGLTVLNAGSGYTSQPILEIDAPPAVPAIIPTVAKGLRIDALELIPGLSYQIESSADLENWMNLGQAFIAESETSSGHTLAEQQKGFFRLRQSLPAP
jgi:hypothetical protein